MVFRLLLIIGDTTSVNQIADGTGARTEGNTLLGINHLQHSETQDQSRPIETNTVTNSPDSTQLHEPIEGSLSHFIF